MIILDFKVDERELAISLEDGIEDESPGCFVTTMFLMPLRMRLNNLELFEINKEKCWSPGPIMDLATYGLMAIKKLKKTRIAKHDIIEGPGELMYTMVGDEDIYVEFFGWGMSHATTVNYDALLEAFEKYAEKVRAFLKERAPQIYAHPYWGPWLRGETECDGSKIKIESTLDASEIEYKNVFPDWYGFETPLEICRSVKETHQSSAKAIEEIKAMKNFLLKHLNQKNILDPQVDKDELFASIDKIKEIKTKEDFIAFVYALSQDFYDNPDSWENIDPGAFLEALAAWTESMDGFYQNFGLKIPENTDWQVMANMLAAAKVYE